MLLNKIKYIISDLLGIGEFEMDKNTAFIEDLKFDSLDMFDLKRALEESFLIKLPDIAYLYIYCRTVGELALYIENKLEEKKEKQDKYKVY